MIISRVGIVVIVSGEGFTYDCCLVYDRFLNVHADGIGVNDVRACCSLTIHPIIHVIYI